MWVVGSIVLLLGALVSGCGADDVEVGGDAEADSRGGDGDAPDLADSATTAPVDDVTALPDSGGEEIADGDLTDTDASAFDALDSAVGDSADVDSDAESVAPVEEVTAVDGTGPDAGDDSASADGASDAASDGASDAADADVVLVHVASGRVLVERRRPDAELSALGPVEAVPLVGREVIVSSGGVELGRAVTDGAGAYSLPLALVPDGPIEVLVAAVSLSVDADGTPALAILDADGVVWPTRSGVPVETTRVWSWIWSVQGEGRALGELGEQTIAEGDGSGAFALLEAMEHARARTAGAFGVSVDELATLGIIWSPSRTPPCLSCYLPEGWGPVVLRSAGGEVSFERGFLISGSAASPQHWTPALLAHEFGHYVMETFSRMPSANGAHSWNLRLWPPLAWSEGFATFFAQWSLSTPELAISRFFTVQSNVQYWVDIEAIGSTPTSDDTSLSMTFPLPVTSGAEDQSLGEGAVAAVLWDLYDDVDGEDESLSLGDSALVAIAEPRLASAVIDSGISGPDLLDYLDALTCGGYADAAELLPRLFGLPWDTTPECLP